MLETFLDKIATGIFTLLISLAGLFGEVNPPAPPAELLGAQNAVGGETYYLSGSGVSATQTTIDLTKFGYTKPDGTYQKFSMTNFGDLGCGTFQPGNMSGKQEFVSFTGITQNANGTAQLTGATRGLERFPPYSASTTLRTSHAGGTIFVISNSPPCFYESYANRTEDETISGNWNFSGNPPKIFGTATATDQVATRAYADSLTISGAPTSTESVMGVSSISTQAEVANGTASTTSGAPKVIPTRLATSSGQTNAGFVPVTNSSGQIPTGFMATSSPWGFGTSTIAMNSQVGIQGDLFVSGTTTSGTLNATSSTIQLGNQLLRFVGAPSASSTYLGNDNSGGLSWNTIPTSFGTGATTSPTGSLATITIPHGLSRTPVYVEINMHTTGKNNAGTASIWCNSVGTATSTASQYVVGGGQPSTVTTYSVGNNLQFGNIMDCRDNTAGGAVSFSANLSALNATNITIAVTTNGSTAYDSTRYFTWTAY